MQQLTDNIFVETHYHGANVSCVTTGDGLVLIDTPQKPSDALLWQREIESKGKIKYLINTEPHFDHFNGNFVITATAVAQEKARELMLAVDINHVRGVIAAMDPEGLSYIDKSRLNVAAITFSERLTLYLGRHSFHLIHLPGHTESQIVVFVPEERVVFTGDNVTCRTQGFLHEADPFAWLKSLKKIALLDVDYIVPGHGEPCDKSYLKEEEEYVQGCMDTVSKAIDRGWTRDEAVARVTLPSKYPLEEGAKAVGPMFLKMSVANLYDRLSRKRKS